MQGSGGAGEGFEVQKYGDGRVALIGERVVSLLSFAVLSLPLYPCRQRSQRFSPAVCSVTKHESIRISGLSFAERLQSWKLWRNRLCASAQ